MNILNSEAMNLLHLKNMVANKYILFEIKWIPLFLKLMVHSLFDKPQLNS